MLSCGAFKLDIIQEDKPCLDGIAHRGFLQNRNGAFTVVELNLPRVAPLHRFNRDVRCNPAILITIAGT